MPDGSNIVPMFGRGFFSKSRTVTSQALTNLYREPQGDADKAQMVFYGTPGLKLFADVSLSVPGCLAIRGMRQVGNYLYFVIGLSSPSPGVNSQSIIFGVDASGAGFTIDVPIVSAGIQTYAGRVGICDNGSQVIIVDGVAGWTFPINATGRWTGGATFLKIADVDFPNGATTVAFLNGYFVCDNPNGSHVGQFNWSAQYDGTTWAALDFANAESSPDALVHVFSNFGQLFLFGTTTAEVWAPSGDAAIFRRVGGAGVEWGLAAKWTVDKFANNSIVFLGKNKLGQAQFVRMDGYTITPLTDPEVTHDLNARGNLQTATGYSYSLDAHTFYQLNFPDKTYLYDDLSQSYSLLSSNGGRHLGEIRAELNAVPYVSDYSSANLYTVDPNTYTDNGATIVREIVGKHVFADYNQVTIAELFIEFEAGVGLATGQGSSPQCMLQWSKDNGATWGNEIWQTIGGIGGYLARAVWRNLGLARDFVFKIRVTDPVKVVITNAAMRVA